MTGLSVKKGLRQIDNEGLRILIDHIEAGEPMCLTGQFYNYSDEGRPAGAPVPT